MPIDDQPRRRAEEAPRYRLNREALALTRPISKQLGRWQLRIARLRGLAEQANRLSAAEIAAAQAEAEALRSEIDAERLAYEALAHAAPAELHDHSVLADAANALVNVSQSIASICSQLSKS